MDLVTHVDGIVSTSSALNALAWAAVSKPAVAWTVDLSPLSPSQLDAYFGQHLLMRVYPLAPMPLNTGAVQPGNGTLETVYRDFAPLFGALRGVRWALREDPASISRPDSFGVNTFDVTDGSGGVYVVVLALVSGGPESEIVSIGAADAMIVSALYPGASGWKPLGTYTPVNGRISVDVPVVRGVALLSLST